MPQGQFQRVKQKQNPSAESSEEDRDSQSQLAQETVRSESESKELSVRLLSGLSKKQPVIKKAMEMQAEAERRRSKRDQQNEINLARGKQPDRDSVEQHPSVQDPGAQARQKQKRTRDPQACLRRYQQRPQRPKKRKTSANPKLSW